MNVTDKDREQLLGYLLGALESDEQAAVEARLAEDEVLRAEAAKLRSSLAPLDEDLAGYEPPAGLAGRTCRLVAWSSRKESASRSRQVAAGAEWGAGASSWTFTDAVVAAGVLIAMALLFLPALVQGRYNAAIAACQNNLKQLGEGYGRYAQLNAGLFPSVAPGSQWAFAGLSPARLLDQGFLSDPAVLRCGSGSPPEQFRAVVEYQTADGEVRRLIATLQRIPDSYAFNVGYRSGGKYQGCRKIKNRCRQGIAGDAPQCHMRGLPPVNHEGRGGNLLFADGHVEFLPQRSTLRQFYVSDAGMVEIPNHVNDDVLAGVTWRLSLPAMPRQ